MLTKGHKVLIIIGVGVVAIVVIVVLLVSSFRTPEPEGGEPELTPEELAAPAETKTVSYTPPPMGEGERDRVSIQNTVMTFAERFGTFSPETGFGHIDQLSDVMTVEFAAWVKTQYKSQLEREYPDNGTYARVRTEALAVEFVSYGADVAEVLVTTKQYKNYNGDEPLTFNRTLRLDLVSQGGDWLISGAYWERT